MSALAAENWLLTDANPTSIKRIVGGGCDTKVPAEVLLRCATPDFRDRLLAIRRAALAFKGHADREHERALVLAYREFYRVYGTGFVSKLVLGSIGVFRGSAVYESAADETKANYGGGVSVSGFYGGFSAAAEYSSKHLNTQAKGSFQVDAFGMPTGSPAASWAEGFLNPFAGQQLAKLGDLKAWQECFEATMAKTEPPEIKAKEPKNDKLPSFAAGDIENQIRDLKQTVADVSVADVAQATLDVEAGAPGAAAKTAPAFATLRSLRSTGLLPMAMPEVAPRCRRPTPACTRPTPSPGRSYRRPTAAPTA